MTTLDWIGAWLFACGFSIIASLIVYECSKPKKQKHIARLYEHYHDGY